MQDDLTRTLLLGWMNPPGSQSAHAPSLSAVAEHVLVRPAAPTPFCARARFERPESLWRRPRRVCCEWKAPWTLGKLASNMPRIVSCNTAGNWMPCSSSVFSFLTVRTFRDATYLSAEGANVPIIVCTCSIASVARGASSLSQRSQKTQQK